MSNGAGGIFGFLQLSRLRDIISGVFPLFHFPHARPS